MSILLSETIEIQVKNSSVPKIKIGRQPKLDGLKILSIETRDSSELTHAPLGNANVSPAVLKKSYLTLETEGKEGIDSHPLVSISPTYNDGKVKSFGGQKVDFENSYIEIAEPTGVTVGTSYILVVSYQK